MHAGIVGANSPHPPLDYLERLFDSYADSFDSHLAALEYRTPDEMSSLLHVSPPVHYPVAADLGCGTGQLGAVLRDIVDTLIGVDLSAGMLAKADARGCYDELLRNDITDFLQAHPQSFDLVVAADCFIYDGDLRPVISAAARSLRPSGRLLFSLETCYDDHPSGYRLEPTGRYTHSGSWAVVVAAAAGLVDVVAAPTVLRLEQGVPVDGVIIDGYRPAAIGCSPDVR